MQAISKVFSLDREAFPSLNGLPGVTHHSESIGSFGDWSLQIESICD